MVQLVHFTTVRTMEHLTHLDFPSAYHIDLDMSGGPCELVLLLVSAFCSFSILDFADRVNGRYFTCFL